MSGFAMGAGGTNAHGDARHNQGRRHVHAHEHETTEWLLDPLTKMTAVSCQVPLYGIESQQPIPCCVRSDRVAVAVR